MGKKAAEILSKLRDLTRQYPVLVPAKVISVNEAEATCEIEINELTFKARLNAAENGTQGFVIIPAVDSWVLAGRLDENGDIWAIISFTAADKIIMRSGSNGGMLNSGSVLSKLNAIEQAINDLKDIITNWVPVTQDGGAALKTAATTWAGNQITETQLEDIEDSNITH